jgi:phage/plasmid-associated DNA primase
MTEFLTVEKQNNITNGLEMIEYIPKQRIHALIISGLLLIDWDEKFSSELNNNKVREQYQNEVQQVKAYLKAYNVMLGGVKIKYSRNRRFFGRSYCSFNYGFTTFRKITRNSLIIDLYYDFDLKNAHPSITQSLCFRAGIPCPEITLYINNRDAILQDVCDRYGVECDDAKDLFIRIGFGGSADEWAKDCKIVSFVPTHFIIAYKREVKEIAEALKKLNNTLWLNIKNNKKGKGDDECLRSFFATYLQEWETRIVSYCLNYLINSTALLKHPVNPNTIVPVGSYEYDGFKLLKETVDKNGGVDTVLQILHQKTTEFGFGELIWVDKQIKDFNDLTDWVEQVQDTEKEDDEFKKVCEEITKYYSRKDAGAVEFINKLFPKNFIYSLEKGNSSNQGCWFCWDGNRWRSNELPLRNAITYSIEKELEKMMLPYTHYKFEPIDKDDTPNANQRLYLEVSVTIQGLILRCCNMNDVNNIVGMSKQTFVDYHLVFDDKPFLLGFENGVLDIETKLFRPYNFEDKVSFSCGYDFVPYNNQLKVWIDADNKPFVNYTKTEKDDIAYKRVDEFFKQIITDPDERKAIRTIQSTGLVGQAVQLFNVYNGSGRNGKGVLNDFTKDTLGDYCVKISSSVLTELRKTSGGSNPEIAKISKMRFVYCREPPKNTAIQNSVMKDLTGNGTFEARMNYSNTSVVYLYLTLVCECNEKPNFAEQPINADAERVRDYLFGSRFTDDIDEVDNIKVFKKDNELPETFKGVEYKNALINLLLDDLFELHKEKYNINAFIPESIKVRSLNYLNKSNDVCNLFLEAFELRKDGQEYVDKEDKPFDNDWTLPAITSIIKSGRTSFATLPFNKQKELTKEKVKEFFENNKIYKKMIYTNTHTKQVLLKGFRLKKKDINDLDE